jgi:hypothetical protein
MHIPSSHRHIHTHRQRHTRTNTHAHTPPSASSHPLPTLPQGFLAEGLQRTPAGLGSVIIDSQPLTVAVLAAALFGERLSPAAVAGLFIGVAGAARPASAPPPMASLPALDAAPSVAPRLQTVVPRGALPSPHQAAPRATPALSSPPPPPRQAC